MEDLRDLVRQKIERFGRILKAGGIIYGEIKC